MGILFMRGKRNIWKRIIPASILLICIIASFAAYLDANRRMTVSRNAKYVEDAANQTAKRIEDLLVGAENSISAIANMYERSFDPKLANVEVLEELTESTVFDYIGYVDAQGIYTDNRGLQADVTDRAYFQNGMQGNSGVDMILNGRVSGEDLVIFYAPLRLDGEVVVDRVGIFHSQRHLQIVQVVGHLLAVVELLLAALLGIV